MEFHILDFGLNLHPESSRVTDCERLFFISIKLVNVLDSCLLMLSSSLCGINNTPDSDTLNDVIVNKTADGESERAHDGLKKSP